MAKRERKGPRLEAQQLHGGKAWYYERNACIEIIVPESAPKLGVGGCRYVKIPVRMLRSSLLRMRSPTARELSASRKRRMPKEG